MLENVESREDDYSYYKYTRNIYVWIHPGQFVRGQMSLELTQGDEFDELLEELFEGDLEYVVGWLLEREEGERMKLLKKGPLWTKDDEYESKFESYDWSESQEHIHHPQINLALDTLPGARVVIISASVLDPKTDHCVSISVQVSDIPEGLTEREAIQWAFEELSCQEIA